MHVNTRTLNLVKHFEGLFLKAYRCPAGVWTIGYGHTGITHQDGSVRAGRTITREEADGLLAHDMSMFSKGVITLIEAPVNLDQYGAIVSLAFNVGLGNLRKSTLLRLVNQGDYWGAANEFHKWNKAGGRVLPGLTRRRASERNLFCSFPTFIVSA